ncbi:MULTISPECIES: hypothetical protein [Sphingobacterium]|uniref:hypothetical protein n=1 Tax=Sphingobacterium TaxID=28453 RepID=UPI00257DF50A|nr:MULTISPECIES: hypothetical protein [Sphingobacterium]
MSLSESEEYLNIITIKYRKDIEQLNKMLLNMYALSSIRYWYSRLDSFNDKSNYQESLLMLEGLTTSIVISYGRIFQSGNGATTLSRSIIPAELRKVHDYILLLRNKKYAHHEKHNSIEAKIELKYVDSTISVDANIQMVFCWGAPREWKPLFKWLDEYFYTNIHKQLDRLTNMTGVRWDIPNIEKPYWID